MNGLWEMMQEVIYTFFGGVITYFATKLATLLARRVKGKEEEETLKSICRTCVYAVEQMYGSEGGKEKLKRALDMGEKLLAERGITVDFETLHCLLESALAEAKGAFERV